MLGNGTWMRLAMMTIVVAFLAGCGGNDDGPAEPDVPDPATHATIGFVFDDSEHQSFDGDDGLACKGEFSHDPVTGLITLDPASGGPFVMLYDDGAVGAGGHEPVGAVAGDHRWGAVVRMLTPDVAVTFDYGLITGSVAGSDGPWINGNRMQSLTVAAGETGTVSAPELAFGFVPPDGHALVTFFIDDTANGTYTGADGLAWKGSFRFDPASRVLTPDASWSGPYVMLYDDGPWTAGGHEPADGVAGDHLWSVAVWVDNTSTVSLEYGAVRGSVEGSDGQWVWSGANGTVTIGAGVDGPVDAPGLVLPLLGAIDLRLTIDLSNNGANLAPGFQGLDHTQSVVVRGSSWAWQGVAPVDDGTAGDLVAADGIFTFLLSGVVGPHDGLLNSGGTTQFVFVLSGMDYRVGGACATAGIAAALDDDGWVSTPVMVSGDGDRNTYVLVP